jgi:hypothetical protein
MKSPGTALREAIQELDVSLPGAAFKAKATDRVADIIDLWWHELNEAKSAATAAEQEAIQDELIISLARIITAMMNSTVGFFQDKDSIRASVGVLSFVIAGCEEYLDSEILPTREIVDIAAMIDGAEDADVSET